MKEYILISQTRDDIISSLKDLPTFTLENDINILDLLVNNNICSSKREAREMVTGNAISINNTKITDIEKVITKDLAIDNKVLLIKRGKKNYYLGIFS